MGGRIELVVCIASVGMQESFSPYHIPQFITLLLLFETHTQTRLAQKNEDRNQIVSIMAFFLAKSHVQCTKHLHFIFEQQKNSSQKCALFHSFKLVANAIVSIVFAKQLNEFYSKWNDKTNKTIVNMITINNIVKLRLLNGTCHSTSFHWKKQRFHHRIGNTKSTLEFAFLYHVCKCVLQHVLLFSIFIHSFFSLSWIVTWMWVCGMCMRRPYSK